MSFVQSDAGILQLARVWRVLLCALRRWASVSVEAIDRQKRKSRRRHKGLADDETGRDQMRRRFCGRQPLCGTGVTSEIELMRMPSEASARTDDSRPGPGPLIRTSRFLMPWSCAARPATSAATWAANGVLLREPLKP